MSQHTRRTARIGLEACLTAAVALADNADPEFAKVSHQLLALKADVVRLRVRLDDRDDCLDSLGDTFGSGIAQNAAAATRR